MSMMETHHRNIDRPDVFCALVLSIDTHENLLVALFKSFQMFKWGEQADRTARVRGEGGTCVQKGTQKGGKTGKLDPSMTDQSF